MKQWLFLIIILPFVFFLGLALRDPPEESLTEDQQIAALLKDMTFNTPAHITVLLNEEHYDKNIRKNIKTMVLKTDEEYLPRTPRVPDKPEAVLDLLKQQLPNGDFGAPSSDQASYFRWLTPNAEWTVSSLISSQGYFSLWQRTSELNELRAE